MRVGIIQPNYLPWRGYFDFISEVDIFVFFDCVQYTKRDWRNRNKIKTINGTEWLTVPVNHQRRSQKIFETTVCDAEGQHSWQASHIDKFKRAYKDAPHLQDALNFFFSEFPDRPVTISDVDIHCTTLICEYLNINTSFLRSSELEIDGSKTQRLISIIKKVGGTSYLSGLKASNYLDVPQMNSNGISVEYKSYDYACYPQLHGDFVGDVTVLDLIANCGPKSIDYMKSKKPNIKA